MFAPIHDESVWILGEQDDSEPILQDTQRGREMQRCRHTHMRTALICSELIKITQKISFIGRVRFITQGILRKFSTYMNAGWEPGNQVHNAIILCGGAVLQASEMFAAFFASATESQQKSTDYSN